MKKIASRIKKIRQLLKLSQEELAQKLGVTKQAISNIENEKSLPSIQLLHKLTVDYSVNSNYVIAGVGSIFLNNEKSYTTIRESILEEVEKMLTERGIN